MNDDDEADFAKLIPGVKRLRTDRINVYRQRRRKPLQPREPDSEPAFKARHPSPSAAARDSYFSTGLQHKLQRKIRQGSIRPEASLDLHGYRQAEALAALENFIDAALSDGRRMLIIIHGQGYRSHQDAILKPLVQRWLAAQTQVLAWCPAKVSDGAAGASYVYLRNR